jgi:peptide/nickel transport system permease protein
MVRYLLGRLLKMLVTLFIISFLIAMMIRLVPGDPASYRLGRDASPEQVEIMRRKMGLDRPPIVQYVEWLKGVLRGDMGLSMRLDIPVTDMVLERYPRTLSVCVLGSIIALVIALSAGIFSALKAGTWIELLVSSVSLAGISLPAFWFGTMLILLFSVKLGWLPTSGYVSPAEDLVDYLKHLMMPALAQGVIVGSLMTRMVRANLLEILHENYITVARAKGLPERVVLLRHALRNALIPIVTTFGITMGYMLGGSVAIESVFVYPGIGQLAVSAIFSRDYVLVQAVVLAYASTFILVNFTTDICYGVLDPRIRVR